MSRLAATLLVLALGLSSGYAVAADREGIEANRREYRLADLENRASEMAVMQVTLRQQVLDAGPELSRKTCDQIAQRMGNEADFKYLRERIKELAKREHLSKFTSEQAERFTKVKRRIATLEADASMDCKALAPINP